MPLCPACQPALPPHLLSLQLLPATMQPSRHQLKLAPLVINCRCTGSCSMHWLLLCVRLWLTPLLIAPATRRIALAGYFRPFAPGNLASAPLADLPKRSADGDSLPAPLSDSFSAAPAATPVPRPANPAGRQAAVLDLTGNDSPGPSR